MRSLTPRSKRWPLNVRRATRSRPNCARPAPGTNRFLYGARGSNWACAPSWKPGLQGLHDHVRRSARAAAAPWPPPQRRWLRVTASQAKATGRQPPWCARWKVMGEGLPGGTPSWRTTPIIWRRAAIRPSVLHMLEICPTIAADKPRLEISSAFDRRQGGDPVRLVFDATKGPALNASASSISGPGSAC